ncbi:MAG: iron-only hydrogenase system regulator [Desulfarculales bacterium]|nr:iron-only hydrogenase system regulator [Desulfarculales bacterium]
MENKIAIIALIVEDSDCAEKINAVLHEYSQYIIGRMGLPYRQKNISIISVVVDAPMDVINTISGKIGSLKGVSTKAVCSK